MKRALKGCLVVAVNLALFAILLGILESYYRISYRNAPTEFTDTNGLWQKFQPYIMVTTAPAVYKRWQNTFTNEIYSANIVTNSLGFNDRHEFDYFRHYDKAANERVVLFTGGSAGWGVGSTSNEATVSGRMEHYLNTLQHEHKYTVINLAMGSWIAYQEFNALALWGDMFQPDWVVVMDGFNDSTVGCQYSQGVGNPLYFATFQSYIDGYLFTTARPVFYRGWLENELIRISKAYRVITGKQYVPNGQIFDNSNQERNPSRRQILPTKVGQSREMLAFYVKTIRAMVKLYPDAGYILSTQPIVNQFTGDFVDIYQSPPGSKARDAATTKRELALETYLTYHEKEVCEFNSKVSFTYIFGNGATRIERLADDLRRQGRNVEYHNMGTLLPDAREERMPYFIDPVHLSDTGNDVLGRFYAQRILARDAGLSSNHQ